MKILLIGLGRYGSAIAKRLLEQGHELIVIEREPTAVERFFSLLSEEGIEVDYHRLRVCVGDATSLLVWDYLDLSELDLLVSSLRNDEVNRAVCSLLREFFKNYELPAVVISENSSSERLFTNYNCKVFLLPDLAATFVEGLTLKNIQKPIGIGLGKNEILEAVVSPKSPYTRVAIELKRLHHWRLGLVYRGERIILPRRRIRLKAGDRAVILGDDPRVVLEVAKAMALGEPQFPLSFGENLLAVLKTNELHYLKEYYYLWKHSRVKNVILFTDRGKIEDIEKHVADRSFLRKLVVERENYSDIIFDREVQSRHSAGIISSPLHRRGFLFYRPNPKRFFEQETPFLVPRLSFPYRRLLVSLNCENPQGLVEPVFEIFQLVKGESLTFLAVQPPEVLLPEREKEKLKRAIALVEEYAKLYGLKQRVNILVKEGNPEKKTLKLFSDHDLLIVGFVPHRIGWLEPYTPYMLTKNSPKSVIGIPTERGEE